jgi:hypothetical protein
MNVNLHSFNEVRGEVRGYWECRVLSPALLWAFPAFSRAGCLIDIARGFKALELGPSRPSFWPAAVKDAPLNVEMPSHTDQQGLRSLKDEADRCWYMAYDQMKERGEWLRLMGAAPCMSNMLLMPFQAVQFTLRFEDTAGKFEDLLNELTNEDQYPEIRLLGYMLCDKTPYQPKTPTPDWVNKLL